MARERRTRREDVELLMRLVPWRKAVIAEAHRLIGTKRYVSTVMKRMDMLERAILFSVSDLEQSWQGDEGPFLVDDGVLMIIGPRREAWRAARSIFGTEPNPWLDLLLDQPAMLE